MAASRLFRAPRPDDRVGLGAALVLLALIVAVETASGTEPHMVPFLAIPSFVAAAFAPWRWVAAMATVSSAVAVGFVWLPAGGGSPETDNVMDVTIVAVAGCVAIAVSVVRQRQNARLTALSRLASVAQQAVLRPVGPQIGAVRLAGRYVSASEHADIGGDLYEALETNYGVRMIIGDVRGKGLPAVRLASTVLGSYRHVAFERADLRAVVSDLDRAVARNVGYEDFVTALLMELRGGTLTIINCGHPPPMLLRGGQIKMLEPDAAAPPLGFMPVATPRIERLEPGDRLLLYTDGLAEARREGRFFPVAERAWGLLGHGSVADGLASLESALRGWVGGPLDDDIALMLVEYLGPRAEPERAPSWRVSGERNTESAGEVEQ